MFNVYPLLVDYLGPYFALDSPRLEKKRVTKPYFGTRQWNAAAGAAEVAPPPPTDRGSVVTYGSSSSGSSSVAGGQLGRDVSTARRSDSDLDEGGDTTMPVPTPLSGQRGHSRGGYSVGEPSSSDECLTRQDLPGGVSGDSPRGSPRSLTVSRLVT
jgi:hypothetical protein